MTGAATAVFTSREFRRACGHFLTGVTVATARGLDGGPVGITLNSFSSVSLEPPLVLISIDARSSTYAAFDVDRAFALHVLRQDQRELSTRFATRAGDKFVGIPWRARFDDVPVLEEFAVLFRCVTMAVHPAGDHGIFVARVDGVELRDVDGPLAFYRGAYVRVEQESAERIPDEAAELWRLGWA